MSRWLVCAARRSSGKTTFAIGLCAALARRGLAVQPFKKGPDYIDPMWLGRAAGRACRNLDPHVSGWSEVERCFARFASAASFSVVEGNLGLHDGLAADGSDSNAALGRRLGLEAILLLDAHGTSRGIAPLALGQQAFDPGLRFAGVVLNRVGGARHEAKLRDALERHTSLRVLGAIPQDASFAITERHLGLVPSNEAGDVQRTIERLADAVQRHVDLDELIASAGGGAAEPAAPLAPAPGAARDRRVRIAIARDRAFGFYYPDDLEALEAAGAELVPFDTLRDSALPAADGLLIGGGFPEALAAGLEANAPLREDLKRRIEGGLPVYAECGGLMYLSRSISWNDARYEMVGAIAADAVMQARPVGKGYVRLRATGELPWPPAGDDPAGEPAGAGSGRATGAGADAGPGAGAAEIVAHEFHHSRLEGLPDGTRFAFEVLRGHGVDGAHDGIVQGNLVAGYAHQRSAGANQWARRFVAFVRERR
ncbi:MAG TPA: cobyrinate a,c-diamide synthase [Burkholderiaceae bacterium]